MAHLLVLLTRKERVLARHAAAGDVLHPALFTVGANERRAARGRLVEAQVMHRGLQTSTVNTAAGC